jgi:ketosteroid isomerase-like protein
MGLEQNKETAKKFLEVMASHENTEWLEDIMCDDATYWVGGRPELFAYAGTRNKQDFCAWARTPSIFVDGGAKLGIVGITAEGDRVAVESTSTGTTPDGRTYHNAYHYLFRVRDGKILEVKEYTDTQAAAEFFSK